MQIDEIDPHRSNAAGGIRDNWQRRRNLTIDKLVQREKESSPRISTEDGMRIDESDEHLSNADFSISASFERQ
jgi:hypothetical protein